MSRNQEWVDKALYSFHLNDSNFYFNNKKKPVKFEGIRFNALR